MRREHHIPSEFVGIPTLIVDYLSLWGEEMEALSVLLATLIIAVILDSQNILSHPWVAIVVAVIIALEFIGVILLALRRRELEHALWEAVNDSAHSHGTGSNR